MKKIQWKKIWIKEYPVTKKHRSDRKYSKFRITKFVASDGDIMYFTSTSLKGTCGTGHGSFGMAYQFGNKGCAYYRGNR